MGGGGGEGCREEREGGRKGRRERVLIFKLPIYLEGHIRAEHKASSDKSVKVHQNEQKSESPCSKTTIKSLREREKVLYTVRDTHQNILR